jgi:WD40 repeat protein
MLRITAATQAGGQPACIWALAALKGGLLASASSRGVVQVFETQFGAQVSTCSHHQADVSCLAVSPCGTNLFAAGVDPSLVLLTPSEPADNASDAPARFQFSDRRRPHSRDVKAMAVVTPRSHHSHKPGGTGTATAAAQQHAERMSWLVTGGNDAQLLVHSADRFSQAPAARITAAPCAPIMAFSSRGRFLAADGESVDVWQPAAVSAVHEKVCSIHSFISLPGHFTCNAFIMQRLRLPLLAEPVTIV